MKELLKQWITELGYETVDPTENKERILICFVADDAWCEIILYGEDSFALRAHRGNKFMVSIISMIIGKRDLEVALQVSLSRLPPNSLPNLAEFAMRGITVRTDRLAALKERIAWMGGYHKAVFDDLSNALLVARGGKELEL